MADSPNRGQNNQAPQTPSRPSAQSIPLQNLHRPPEDHDHAYEESYGQYGGQTAGATYHPAGSSGGAYEALSPAHVASHGLPGITTYWDSPYAAQQHGQVGLSPDSPIDPAALQFALPPDISQASPTPNQDFGMPSAEAFQAVPAHYYDEPGHSDVSDRVPLTTSAEPISGTLSAAALEPQPRDSFQTVSDLDGSPSRPRGGAGMLGDDLDNRHRSYGNTLAPDDRRRSRSPSTSGALYRSVSIVRAMSQRVVDISGGGEAMEQQLRRQRETSPAVEDRHSHHPSAPMLAEDTSYRSQIYEAPTEKNVHREFVTPAHPSMSDIRPPMPNPLKGRTLGIFPPNSKVRLALCDFLMLPWVEPLILILIVLQAILLAIEAAPNVWSEGNARPATWGTAIDWAIFGLFIVFTIEIVIRIIVSGLIMNAAEYSTIDRKRGVRGVVADQYRTFFRPQRQKSVKKPPQEAFGPSTFVRSFTRLQGQRLPETFEEQQRMQLARRAFLRHGFNRLDFVAVVAFWISFALRLTGLEHQYHLYVFRMLSCLRIIRLLGITKGNAIILRSLKKAAPLLVRVSFLIGFFWLLFAIIGVQSFKSSLSRQCVWLDPEKPTDLSASFTNDFGFCGGHVRNDSSPTPNIAPWVFMDEPGDLTTLRDGASSGKGFICPRGSICLQQQNPFNGTLNFDDILHSLELVFVIMSANTFTDLMYYTMDSDYLPAALFFGAGIMIMMLWMTNLLIAVITSSFQVIREEQKGSAFTADQNVYNPATRMKDNMRRVSGLQIAYNKTKYIWILLIAFDLFAQGFRSATPRPDRDKFLNVTEIVVTVLLDIEIAIRFAADWKGFHRKLYNVVDCFLAVSTTVILIPPIRNSGQVYAWLTIFQILRIYRIVLAVPITRDLIKLVLGNATGIGNLMLFVFLITFLMAIFASQLFRGEITPTDSDGEDIRITFASIFNSFLGMYQILSSENWTAILYTVTGFTTDLRTSWIGAIFLIGWFILSYFILINMFIAVIQENFDVSEDQKRLEQVKAFLQRKELGGSSSNLALSSMFTLGRNRKRKDPLDYGPATMEMLLKEAVVQEFLNEAMDPLQDTPEGGQSPQQMMDDSGVKPGLLSNWWGKLVAMFSSRDPNPFYSNFKVDGNNEAFDPRQMARQAVNATAARRKAQREYLARHKTYNNALFIFTPRNPLRRLCQRLVGPGRGSERFDGVEPNKYAWFAFSAFIYISIVAMVIIACVTTPLFQKEYFDAGHKFSFGNWFVWTDVAFAVVFSAEAVIKIIADGFFWTPNAYFRSSWGIIDAVVLITLWINVGTLFANDGAVSRAVGAFKALRALRLLNVSDSARQTFHALIIVGGWKVLSAAFVSISLLIPFALYGVTLFHGQMVSCNDGSGAVTLLKDCFGEYNSTPFNGPNNTWNLLAPRVAQNDYFSFDDFGSSIFILFTIVSQEGWVDVSFAAQAITGRGLQPQFGNAQGNALFFVVFNLLATVFILTLFISVFMRNYTELTGVAFLTAEQRSWLELRKLLRQISPSKSSYDDKKNQWKKWCHKRAIEKRGKWYISVTIVLVLHLILLIVEYSNEPDAWITARDYLFLAFTLIFVANIVIRITGLGWSRFRRSSWDLYSLIAVTGTLITSILYLANPGQGALVRLHKSFLVAILLLLIPRNDALDQLFKTAAASLTVIGNLLATWLVFFLVFAIALTQAFSLTRFGGEETNNLNFRTVPNALILLFKMSCGEGWNQIMMDFANIEPPRCVEASTFFEGDCGSNAWARSLFILWNLISMYIFVNLFVSLIYESFSYVYQRSSGLADVDRDEIRRFKEAWRSVDPDGSGFISKEAFPRLLAELSGVFEMRIYRHEDSVRSILADVRADAYSAQTRHESLVSQTALTGVNLRRLNDRINQIDIEKVRERRRKFMVFYEEVMVSADPDKGISFTTVLMILAHYNIISDSKSLRSVPHRVSSCCEVLLMLTLVTGWRSSYVAAQDFSASRRRCAVAWC
jgi:voltage-dependent calcium channel